MKESTHGVPPPPWSTAGGRGWLKLLEKLYLVCLCESSPRAGMQVPSLIALLKDNSPETPPKTSIAKRTSYHPALEIQPLPTPPRAILLFPGYLPQLLKLKIKVLPLYLPLFHAGNAHSDLFYYNTFSATNKNSLELLLTQITRFIQQTSKFLFTMK